FGPFVLDCARRLLLRDGAPVGLTPKAFDLLTVLAGNDGRLVTKQALMDALWPDTAVEESNLTFQISTLRKALGDSRLVVTIPGQGYQFAGGAQRLADVIVEDEERTTVTVAEERRTRPLAAIAVLALVIAGVAVAAIVLWRQASTPPASGIRSIAVLPFRPIVAAQRDESLELGMADALITRLSRMSSIVVRPTSAVRRYTSLEQDPLAAGRELGVDAVLDGSIQRRGDRVRVTVRLLRTSDGRSVWSTQFYQRVRDLFELQDSVTDGIARSVVPALSARERELLAKRTTDDVEAYELYAQGLYWKDRDRARALELFELAIARDARFAAAWAAIADVRLMRGRYTNANPREQFESARGAAAKALALDPQLAEAHASLASILSDYDWKWDEAEREYQRALALDPNSGTAHIGYATLLVYRRRFDTAIGHAARAAELDPRSPSVHVARGLVLRYSGRNEEGIASLRAALRLQPDLTPAVLHTGMAEVNTGRVEEGLQTLGDLTQKVRTSSQVRGLYAYAAAKAGRREEALHVLHELEAAGETESVAEANIALAWTALGDRDKAFAWLERAYRTHSYLLRVVTVEQGYEPLRSDPRYADLLRRMSLP
ncbi:MAG TPA: winged helix-turn-helix domain-containing protein, partial [Thermoanaerobaculia bacterium]|nr:winged helix-turn-helix domain-containing protein [Thermoanaerobaculia bacterium]